MDKIEFFYKLGYETTLEKMAFKIPSLSQFAEKITEKIPSYIQAKIDSIPWEIQTKIPWKMRTKMYALPWETRRMMRMIPWEIKSQIRSIPRRIESMLPWQIQPWYLRFKANQIAEKLGRKATDIMDESTYRALKRILREKRWNEIIEEAKRGTVRPASSITQTVPPTVQVKPPIVGGKSLMRVPKITDEDKKLLGWIERTRRTIPQKHKELPIFGGTPSLQSPRMAKMLQSSRMTAEQRKNLPLFSKEEEQELLDIIMRGEAGEGKYWE